MVKANINTLELWPVLLVNLKWVANYTDLPHFSTITMDSNITKILDPTTSSAAAKGCFWEMTPTRGISRYHLFLLIEDSMGYVE